MLKLLVSSSNFLQYRAHVFEFIRNLLTTSSATAVAAATVRPDWTIIESYLQQFFL